MDRLNRSSNSINIATFWENYQMNKYNFNPAYQRRGDVWEEKKRSFLIDTIFKNFPMPPIFLHQHIDDEKGLTIYEIIDGKQRLTSVVNFIKNEISLPEDFSKDFFGAECLNGLYFKDLDKPEMSEYKKSFWRYTISIEYIDTDDTTVIDNIFDRLNRNGEPLNPQELRKAKYNRCEFYKLADELSKTKYWINNLSKLKINRYDDVEFVSELLLLILENDVNDASQKDKLDNLYEKYCKDSDNVITIEIGEIKKQFLEITSYLENLKINLKEYKIDSVSHLYGLWGFAWVLCNNSNKTDYSSKLGEFFRMLRNNNSENIFVENYKNSMQSNTKSKSNRTKRINALLGFCNTSLEI